MTSVFYNEKETPADMLEQARSMLRFTQSWLLATHESQPDVQEMIGFSYTLEAIEFLVLRAEEKARKEESRVIA